MLTRKDSHCYPSNALNGICMGGLHNGLVNGMVRFVLVVLEKRDCTFSLTNNIGFQVH